MRRSQAGLLGATTADRRRETMRERRLERKRAEDTAGYRAAFKLIDMDNNGHVSYPSESSDRRLSHAAALFASGATEVLVLTPCAALPARVACMFIYIGGPDGDCVFSGANGQEHRQGQVLEAV